jgi:glycosyltransferase involved in cell wall biosynthesis
MSRQAWAILTGEYPPQPGGVSDYTRLLARGLAEAGDEVHVWAPPWGKAAAADAAVRLHTLPDQFGMSSLTMLDDALNRLGRPCRILVQYVPHAFGQSAMNVPFCLWLLSRRKQPIWIMFHEVVFPFVADQPWRHALLAVVTRLMALAVVRAAERAFVAIPAWGRLLQPMARSGLPIQWLPVFSNLPTSASAEAAAAVRRRIAPNPESLVIGHFGTFGNPIAEILRELLPELLHRDNRRIALLIGRGGEEFASNLLCQDSAFAGRIIASGGVPEQEAAAHLQACDLLVQPYPDGASSRRGSLLAGLALGLPILTTEGALSEPLWCESGAVALAPAGNINAMLQEADRLLGDRCCRLQLAAGARELYQSRFAIERTIAALTNGGRQP